MKDGGGCDHPFMVPNVNDTACVLAGRIDIARHYMLTGGPEALKEPYERAVSRLLSFGRYMWDPEKYPEVKALFDSDKFQVGVACRHSYRHCPSQFDSIQFQTWVCKANVWLLSTFAFSHLPRRCAQRTSKSWTRSNSTSSYKCPGRQWLHTSTARTSGGPHASNTLR
jgi:hypothetical protein